MTRCTYCGGDGHTREQCRWPQWHQRHDQDGSWAAFVAAIVGYFYLLYGLCGGVYQIVKIGTAK